MVHEHRSGAGHGVLRAGGSTLPSTVQMNARLGEWPSLKAVGAPRLAEELASSDEAATPPPAAVLGHTLAVDPVFLSLRQSVVRPIAESIGAPVKVSGQKRSRYGGYRTPRLMRARSVAAVRRGGRAGDAETCGGRSSGSETLAARPDRSAPIRVLELRERSPATDAEPGARARPGDSQERAGPIRADRARENARRAPECPRGGRARSRGKRTREELSDRRGPSRKA